MIVFDFDGVLSDSTLWYEDVCRRVSEHHAVEYTELLGWMIEHGNRSWLTGVWNDEHFVSALNHTFDIGTSLEEIEAACEESMRYDDDVMAILRELGTVTVFTDNPLVRVRVMERTLPVPATIICSQQVGVRKHNDFPKFVEASGIETGLFVDDYAPNVDAAKNAGFEGLVWQIGKNRIEELRDAVRAAKPSNG